MKFKEIVDGPDFLLGGYQTDFSVNYTREEKEIFGMFQEALLCGLEDLKITASDIEAGYVGNFGGELYAGQGLMGGFFANAIPELDGIPTGRYEAACASGSLAALAAMSDIEAGRYDLTCVVGIELMRNVSAVEGADHLGAAMWRGHEGQGVDFPFPHLFGRLGDVYDERYGLKREHLVAISKTNFENARRNPLAQTRKWSLPDEAYSESDDLNPVIDGRIRKLDCSQVTDGAAVAFLASEKAVQAHAKNAGIKLDDIPRIEGWGHASSYLPFQPKIDASVGKDYVFPSIRKAITDAQKRAGVVGPESLNGYEVHDCFSTTEYMAIDHLGLTKPGENWKAIENGDIAIEGKSPINASGGLIGVGHPVGATGVRMMLDAHRQVTNAAGDYQIPGAKKIQTLNIGGSATTSISFVIAG